jgi:hypothetical protein
MVHCKKFSGLVTVWLSAAYEILQDCLVTRLVLGRFVFEECRMIYLCQRRDAGSVSIRVPSQVPQRQVLSRRRHPA